MCNVLHVGHPGIRIRNDRFVPILVFSRFASNRNLLTPALDRWYFDCASNHTALLRSAVNPGAQIQLRGSTVTWKSALFFLLSGTLMWLTLPASTGRHVQLYGKHARC